MSLFFELFASRAEFCVTTCKTFLWTAHKNFCLVIEHFPYQNFKSLFFSMRLWAPYDQIKWARKSSFLHLFKQTFIKVKEVQLLTWTPSNRTETLQMDRWHDLAQFGPTQRARFVINVLTVRWSLLHFYHGQLDFSSQPAVANLFCKNEAVLSNWLFLQLVLRFLVKIISAYSKRKSEAELPQSKSVYWNSIFTVFNLLQ